MNVNDLYPRKWLTPEDIQGRSVTVEIAAVSLETVRNPRTNTQEPKLCVAFKRAQRRMLLNKTQAFALADACGSADTERWPGRRVTLSVGIAPNRQATIVVSAAAQPSAGQASDGEAADAHDDVTHTDCNDAADAGDEDAATATATATA